MKLINEGGLTRVGYVAPPPPVKLEPKEGEAVIDIAEPEGNPVTVMTYEQGMTFYLHRERWDWGAAERYAEAISKWLADPGCAHEAFIGLPPASMPEEVAWIPRSTLQRVHNIHDNVSMSPLSESKAGRQGGSRIIVAQPSDLVIGGHGPGKRRRR